MVQAAHGAGRGDLGWARSERGASKRTKDGGRRTTLATAVGNWVI
jgi:hypothetical protein